MTVKSDNPTKEATPKMGRTPRPCPDLDASDLTNTDFRRVNLEGANLVGRDLSGADFTGADLTSARLTGATMKGCQFRGATMTRTNLVGADLSDSDFTECTAERAIFGECDLTNTEFFGADLTGANLSGATAVGADFRAAKLDGARLLATDLSDCDLTRATLSGADLTGCLVRNAIFKEADLSRACLRGLKEFDDADWIDVAVNDMEFSGAYRVRRSIMDQNYLHEFRSLDRQHELLYKVWQVTSDCGRSFVRWGFFTAVVTVIFSLAFTQVAVDYGDNHTIISPLYFSVVTITSLGYGDALPESLAAQILVLLEVVVGYVMLGGVLSIFATRMGRRAD